MRKVIEHTGWPSIGVVPWLRAASRLPSEDGVQLEDINAPRRPGVRAKVVVPQLSRIANFDDFDPLREEPEIELVFVPPGATAAPGCRAHCDSGDQVDDR